MNLMQYLSTKTRLLIVPIASGLYFALNSNPRVETRGYNIAAPPVLGDFFGIKADIFFLKNLELSWRVARTQAAISKINTRPFVTIKRVILSERPFKML